MGQAAFLMKNPLAVERIFYDSVPGKVFSAGKNSKMFYVFTF